MSKSLLRILPLFFAIIMVSCSKEEVTPTTTPGGTSSVQVEYRVYAASANATIYAMLPVAGQQTLNEEKITLNRMTYSQTFEVVSGTAVSLSASNTNPGPEEVVAEIYVNGVLLSTASANAPGQTANASGVAR